MAEYEVKFEDIKTGTIDYAAFKGDFASLILEFDRLKDEIKVLEYAKVKSLSDLEETQELVKCFTLDNALMSRNLQKKV